MYSDPDRSARLAEDFIRYLGDLPFVKYGCVNEGNQGGGKPPQAVKFHRDVLYPAFIAATRVPFSFGPVYSDEEDLLEAVKKIAGQKEFWGDGVSKIVFREVHQVRDSSSPHFLATVKEWAGHPIRIAWQADGVKPRPTAREFASVVEAALALKNIEIPVPEDTKVKFLFECLGEVDGPDPYSTKPIAAANEVYEKKFGAPLANIGKYPDDWQDPGPPPEPPTVLSEVCRESQLLPNEWCPSREVKTFIKGEEPTVRCAIHKAPEKPCSYFLKRWNILGWLHCVLLGKH